MPDYLQKPVRNVLLFVCLSRVLLFLCNLVGINLAEHRSYHHAFFAVVELKIIILVLEVRDTEVYLFVLNLLT